jgi:hypothetical protein
MTDTEPNNPRACLVGMADYLGLLGAAIADAAAARLDRNTGLMLWLAPSPEGA